MTTFDRSGFWRTSKNGVQHWVSGTTVHREDWSRTSYSYTPHPAPRPPAPPPRDPFLERYPEFRTTRRRAACFVTPNARCPVCGASVFYYQNEHGSRVFFDELGPPWPKHPCTDTQSATYSPNLSRPDGDFEVRRSAAIAEIYRWHESSGFNAEAEFSQKYGAAPWPLATIVKRLKSGKLVFLILKPVQQGHATNVYVSCKSLPRCCKDGVTVAIRKAKLSFFDIAEMAPKEVAIKRYRGASAFLNAMVE